MSGGGCRETHALMQAVRELRAEVAELHEGPEAEPLTDVLAHWLAAHYVAAARNEAARTGGAGLDLKTLRGLTEDVVSLRRGDHETARLAVEREWLELARQKKIDAGLDALAREVKSIPGAVQAYEVFANMVRGGVALRTEHLAADTQTCANHEGSSGGAVSSFQSD